MSSVVKKGSSVKSVENALAVLEVFGEIDGEIRLAHLSERLNMNKSNIFRILTTFEQRGYVEQVKKTGEYRLGIRAYEVGQKVLSRMGLLRSAKPLMESLLRECDETVYLAVPDGQEILLLEKVDTSNPVNVMPLVGKRYPLSRSAAGEIILAYNSGLGRGDSGEDPGLSAQALDAIRQRGFSVDFEGLGEGVASLAVPLFNAQKKVLGCLCFVGPQFRFTEEKIKNDLLPPLEAAGRTVSSQLGYLGYWMVERGSGGRFL